MRHLTISCLFATLLFTAGCAPDQARAYKMHQTSGKMTRSHSDMGYRAICKTIVPGSHEGIWVGTTWSDQERAMRDAVEHNKQYPGHEATFEHF